MARSQKRPRQLEFELRRDKDGQRRGVGRRNIRSKLGRPARDPHRPSERHKVRSAVNPRHPQHVTLRVVRSVGYLRRRHVYDCFRRALGCAWHRTDFSVVHFSIQGTHLHLLCEAHDKAALAEGIKALCCSFAQRVNRAISRRTGIRMRGAVFADRYFVRPIGNVRQVRHALAYVLNNFRHHRTRGPTLLGDRFDFYSSAVSFPGWKERILKPLALPKSYETPPVKPPATWLLSVGYQRARPISVYEVPGESPEREPDTHYGVG